MSRLTKKIEENVESFDGLLGVANSHIIDGEDVERAIRVALSSHEVIIRTKLMSERMGDSIAKDGIQALLREKESLVGRFIVELFEQLRL